MCELKVNPNASIVESQFVLFCGAKVGDTRSSPGPNERTSSEARDADAIKAVWSSSECCVP